ncbi:MAG: AAA family ATPase [Candidatus Fermentibacteraceae bacterium]|nr:AAA family ATPase [Candidatus Fermentibacteraceae bacterium]
MGSFTPFTGRIRELEQLENMLEGALEYGGSMVFIRGAIGVGKTRLLDQFTESIRQRGFHILEGRSVRDPVRSFSPFTDMVEDFLCNREHSPSWMVKYLSPGIAANILHLIPVLRDLYPIEVPEAAQPESTLSVVRAFQDFFQGLSRSRPLVMVLDDVQWISPEGLTLLRFLAGRISDIPILLMAGARSGAENQALDRLMDDLNVQRLVRTMDLQNLSFEESSLLLDTAMHGAAPEHFKHWLSSLSKGNPLFMEEILKALIRQEVIHTDRGKERWKVEEGYRDFTVSETLESVVRYRLGQLDAEELRILECAAVIGDSFSMNTLNGLLEEDAPEDPAVSVGVLSSQGILVASKGRYQFAHPLLRHVLYSGMEVNRRRRLHRELASILEDMHGNGAGIALHLTRDLLPEEETPELALRLFRLAMDLKEKSLDYSGSWEYMSMAWSIARGLELAERDSLRIKAEYEYLAWVRGEEAPSCQEAEAMLEDLVELGLRREAALTCRQLFHTALAERLLDRAEEYLDRGIALLEERDSFYWFLRVEETLLMRRRGLLQQSLEDSRMLIGEIPRDGAPEALYKVYSNMGLVSFLMGEVNEAHSHMLKAWEIVRDHNLNLHSVNARQNLGLILMTMGDLDSAMREFSESMREAELLHREPLVSINLLYVANCCYYKGDFEKALRYLETAERKEKDTHSGRFRLFVLRLMARIRQKAGMTEEALRLLEEIESSPIAEQMECDLLIMKASLALEQEHVTEAIEFTERALSLAKKESLGTKIGYALGIRGMVHLARGDTKSALEDLEGSVSWLLEKGEVPMMSDIMVNFGLMLGEEQGEDILLKGLELLIRMNADQAIKALAGTLEEKGGFERVLKTVKNRAVNPWSRQMEILTFGGLSIRQPGELREVARKDWGYAKSRELLGLLLLPSGPSGVTRDSLAAHLWPDVPDRKAQASLRVALTHLRKVVGEDAIVQEGQYLSLNRDLVRTDLWEFDALAKEWRVLLRDGKAHAAEYRARRAMELYGGDFLPEFYSLPLEDEQFRLQNLMRELLLWMAERCMARVEYRYAVRYARDLLAMDPCSEKACRIIMEGLAASGDRTGAIRQYMRLRKSLVREFDTEPGSSTVELYERLTGT